MLPSNSDNETRKTVCFAEYDEVFLFEDENKQHDEEEQATANNTRGPQEEIDSCWETRKVALWYSNEEMLEIRDTIASDAAALKANAFDVLLLNTFGHSYNEKVQDYLDSYTKLAGNSRGIERRVCREHNEDRKMMTSIAIETILLEQCHLREHHENFDEIWSNLANLSLEFSHEATIFAQRIALADASAILEPEEEDLQSNGDEHRSLLSAGSLSGDSLGCQSSIEDESSIATTGTTTTPPPTIVRGSIFYAQYQERQK